MDFKNPTFVAGLGIEPRCHPSKGRVLPLDDSALREKLQ